MGLLGHTPAPQWVRRDEEEGGCGVLRGPTRPGRGVAYSRGLDLAHGPKDRLTSPRILSGATPGKPLPVLNPRKPVPPGAGQRGQERKPGRGVGRRLASSCPSSGSAADSGAQSPLGTGLAGPVPLLADCSGPSGSLELPGHFHVSTEGAPVPAPRHPGSRGGLAQGAHAGHFVLGIIFQICA